LLQPSFA